MLSSLPDVAEVVRTGDGPPTLLLEVPHGATATAHYAGLRARLRGPFPEGLDDFFHVNTDVGAPEVALALARAWGDALVLRSLVPRTFIDCNRVLDLAEADYRAGKVTPGLPPYVRDPDDQALLRGLHAQYTALAEAAFAEVCGAGGAAVMVHSYAPRSVDVEVDDAIGPSLRAAYADEGRWPKRPEIDLIARDPEGALAIPEALLAALREDLGAAGFQVALSETYPMHPATAAYRYARRYPGRTLCVEVRRDLLADPFDPFAQMNVPEARAERVAGPLAAALRRYWA